jgi:glycosyltransferase involved in cell wall biosynthesis
VCDRKLAGHLQLMRPYVRRLLPKQLHHLAGHVGRWLIRSIESHVPNVPIDPPTLLPTLSAAPNDDRTQAPIVIINGSLSAGGAERQIVNLLHGLIAMGQPASLLTLWLDGRPDFQFFMSEINIIGESKIRNAMPSASAERYLTKACGADAYDAFLESLRWAPPDVRSDIIRLAAELHQIGPRVVHGFQDATGICAAFAALSVGTPRVIVSGRNLHPEHFSYARPYMRAAYRFLSGHRSVTLANNSVAGARSYAEWLNLRDGAIRVVRNGMATNAFTNPSAQRVVAFQQNLGLKPGERLVGSIFRLQAEKRPLLWLEVAARVNRRMPNTRFVIFGDGTMHHQMQRAALRLGLGNRLLLPGNTSEANLAIAAMDVLLLTSSYEGTPNVVLEATCLGVPIVATDAGGTPEAMIDGQTGLLVHEHEVDSLADALADATVRILDGCISRSEVKILGTSFINTHFGFDRMIEETLALYDEPGI